MNKTQQQPQQLDKLIAVYGTLKQQHGNHIYMGGSQFLGTHVTEPAYTMYSLGGFPAVTKEGSTPISIEVYRVTDPEDLQNIYGLEGYSGERDSPRNRFYDTTDVETPYGTAEMFIFKTPPATRRVVESGVWE